jgi:MFS superfamily sulfate permease-like transporter
MVKHNFTFDTIRKDALGGTITGLMAIPLTIGICLMSEYPIQTGLLTVVFASIIGFITFLFKPGNYVGTPGVAAGLAPVLAMGIHTFGMVNMPFLIFMTAVFQAIIWKYDWQKYLLKAIPSYLVEGLLAGVGLKIAMKFLPYTYDTIHHSLDWHDPEIMKVVTISIISMIIFLYLFNKFKKSSPGVPYFAIIGLSVVVAFYTELPMLQIDHAPIKLLLPLPDFTHISPLVFIEMMGYALMLATIDVIEQVMSNAAIEKIDPLERPADTNNSLLAIWVANLGSSFFGGMTNLDGLAKSQTNAMAGSVTKMSNLFTAIVILVFIIFHQLLEYLPEYSLAVLMIFTGWKMISGIFHVASEGKYALMLSLFCGVLVFKLGIFEGLVIALSIHSIISYIIDKHHDTPTWEIIIKFLEKFAEEHHAHTTETMIVSKDPITKGIVYKSRTSPITDKKSLTSFIQDWAHGINSHSVLNVINTYDYQALLWGTFAKELRSGHSNIKKYFDHLFELDKLSVEFDSQEVRNYNEIYIQSGSYTFTYYKRGKEIKVPARYSFVCKKEKTGWYILEHHSSEFPA